MATTIKLKSGSGAPLAGDLVAAEPALDLTNKRLYTENASGTVIEVGTNPTSLTTGTFTSTGIDDNATSTAITIDSSQNVGVGTASPDGTFHVKDAIAQVYIQSNDGQPSQVVFGDVSDASGGMIEYTSSNEMTFKTNNLNERMRIDSSGNVGIGTASPSTNLDIQGSSEPVQLKLRYTGNTTGLILKDFSGGEAQIVNADNGPLVFKTNNDEKFRVTNTGNVGIGTTSPSNMLHISSSDPTIRLQDTDATGYCLINAASNSRIQIKADEGNNDANTTIEFHVDGSERMRIDTSGNLLVGKTAASGFTLGAEIKADGTGQFTVDNNPPLYANRKSSNGNIIVFAKDNTTVGSIGVFNANEPYFARQAGTTTGIKLNAGYVTAATSTGADADGSQSLGSSSARWLDLYLSGGAYLGGTGAANKLDDYEVGDWTPAISGLSPTTITGCYVKIGNICYIGGFINFGTTSDTTPITITGFPFSCNSDNDSRAGLCISYSTRTTFTSILMNNAAAEASLRNLGGTVPTNADFSGKVIHFGGVYETT